MKLQVFKERITNPTIRVRDPLRKPSAQSLTSRTADLEICNGQGVYKGGISKLQEQLNQLNNKTNTNSEIKRTMNEDEVVVYPNPATNFTTISCKNAKRIIISDLLGHKISDNKLDSEVKENKIPLDNLSSGIYFYKVVKLDNSVYSGKLIID